MKQKQRRNSKGRAAKSVLRLPDLELARSAVVATSRSWDDQPSAGRFAAWSTKPQNAACSALTWRRNQAGQRRKEAECQAGQTG